MTFREFLTKEAGQSGYGYNFGHYGTGIREPKSPEDFVYGVARGFVKHAIGEPLGGAIQTALDRKGGQTEPIPYIYDPFTSANFTVNSRTGRRQYTDENLGQLKPNILQQDGDHYLFPVDILNSSYGNNPANIKQAAFAAIYSNKYVWDMAKEKGINMDTAKIYGNVTTSPIYKEKGVRVVFTLS